MSITHTTDVVCHHHLFVLQSMYSKKRKDFVLGKRFLSNSSQILFHLLGFERPFNQFLHLNSQFGFSVSLSAIMGYQCLLFSIYIHHIFSRMRNHSQIERKEKQVLLLRYIFPNKGNSFKNFKLDKSMMRWQFADNSFFN